MIEYLLKMEHYLTDPTWYKVFLKQNWNFLSSDPKNSLHPHLMYIHWIIFIDTLLRPMFRKEDLENCLHQKLN